MGSSETWDMNPPKYDEMEPINFLIALQQVFSSIEISQRNPIGLAIRAFVRLKVHPIRTGVSWFDAKTGTIRSPPGSPLGETLLI